MSLAGRLDGRTRARPDRVTELEDIQRATLNILEDLDEERQRFESIQRATVNILEDLDEERAHFGETQRATMNILDDLGAEKERTEAANVNLALEITRRTQAEEAISAKASELGRSNDELQQFAYVASHDLQEPLRTVRGAVTYLAKKYGPVISPDDQKYVKFALDGSVRMQTLIEDLLAFSRVGTRGETPVPIDPHTALERALANLRASIEAAHGEIVASRLPQVMADEGQLTQLFQNLIGNAVKFHGEAPPRVVISAAQDGNMIHFKVADNGIGIDPQYHDRLFVIFQRLHRGDKYQGTGIGLAIAKKIVERHGGRIWIESAVGVGSTFHFTIRSAEVSP